MKKQIVLISALTASLLTFFPSQKSSASVLTFDINGIQNGALISQDYGDNINSTNNGILTMKKEMVLLPILQFLIILVFGKRAMVT